MDRLELPIDLASSHKITLSPKWPYGLEALRALHSKLVAEYNEQLDSYKVCEEDILNNDDGSNGFPDDAMTKTVACNGSTTSSLLAHHSKRMAQIRETLERIVSGAYTGYCKRCGQAISLDRLDLEPGAQLCQKCIR